MCNWGRTMAEIEGESLNVALKTMRPSSCTRLLR